MKEMPLTRRRFLQGCAGVGALTVAGGTVAATQAFAEGGDIGAKARPEWSATYTICEGCPNGCSFEAYVVDGKLEKTLGNATDPNAAGNLCARGYGYTQSAFSDARVKNPLRRKDNGDFQTVSWDDAIQEIGDALNGYVSIYGPDAVALIYNGAQRNARSLSTLFMSALGSGNIFVDDLTYDVVKASALRQTVGVDSCYADVANADVVLLVDTSLADITTPNLVASLQKARAAGADIIAIDPRLGTLASFAGDWYAANPGTELALLLAICQYLSANGLYDKAFVDANVAGFDAWADAISEYTPSWAQEVTGVESYRIEQLASKIHEAAPRVAIQYGNGNIAGTSYANSPETERVICLLNAMLGAWGSKGGTYLPYDFSAIPAKGVTVPEQPVSSILERVFQVEGSASAVDAGACYALSPKRNVGLKALFAVDADVAYDYSELRGLDKVLDRLDLFVCISEEMTETAQLADFVLPLSSYLERSSIPEPVQGSYAAYSASTSVIEPKDGVNARPLANILDGILEVCDVNENVLALATTVADAKLAACGLSAEGIAQNGTSAISEAKLARVSKWNTPSGKIECLSSPQLAPYDADLPLWVEPLGASNIKQVVSDDMNFGTSDENYIIVEGSDTPTFQLITGQQTPVGMHGYNTEELMAISEKYQMDSAWINAEVAKVLGIEQDDVIVIHNGQHACEIKANVTQRIVPTAIFIPMSYGRQADRQKVAKGIGDNVFLFSDAIAVPGTGAFCFQEACVSVLAKKVGA